MSSATGPQYRLVKTATPVSQIIDTDTNRPVACTLTDCVIKGKPICSKHKIPKYYIILDVSECPEVQTLQRVHATAPTSRGGAYDARQRTLLVKLPFRKVITCPLKDQFGAFITWYDLKPGSRCTAMLKFGGVWPTTEGYTWTVDCMNVVMEI